MDCGRRVFMLARSRPISHRDPLVEEIVHLVALCIRIGAETRFTGRIAKITLEVGPAMSELRT